jgi:predicted nucleic acid-binding protein
MRSAIARTIWAAAEAKARFSEVIDRALADGSPDHERFENRILIIDQQIAETWRVIMARGQEASLTLGSIDAMVAATAETHAHSGYPQHQGL